MTIRINSQCLTDYLQLCEKNHMFDAYVNVEQLKEWFFSDLNMASVHNCLDPQSILSDADYDILINAFFDFLCKNIFNVTTIDEFLKYVKKL